MHKNIYTYNKNSYEKTRTYTLAYTLTISAQRTQASRMLCLVLSEVVRAELHKVGCPLIFTVKCEKILRCEL